MRSLFLDYDARRDPKTDRYCAMCQRDIAPGSPTRVIQLRVSDMHVLHPDDAESEGETELLGMDCAQKIGFEWSRPE